MSFHSFDDVGHNFSSFGGSSGTLPSAVAGGAVGGSSSLESKIGAPPRSLVKCGMVVGEMPFISNKIRALARVIQNADAMQFPDIRDAYGDLEEQGVRRVLKDMGVTLTKEEERIFPIALRETRRTLWRATVYGRRGTVTGVEDEGNSTNQGAGGDSFNQSNNNYHMNSDNQPESAVKSISKVLEIWNSIDTEAAFAGSALGSIPDGVLLAYTTFAKIAQMENEFSTKKVLICLYEKMIDPLQNIYQIIRDHNLYQTRKQAVFSEEEMSDIRIENEKLNFLMKHLEMILSALAEGPHFSMARLFDDKFIINVWSTCFGDNTVAVPMKNFKQIQEEQQQRSENEGTATTDGDKKTTPSSSRVGSASDRLRRPSSSNQSHLSTSTTPSSSSSNLFDYDFEAVEYFFDHFPHWSREMLKSVLDFNQHGVLSVFSLQKALKIWGPSTLMPFKVANDIRRKRFLLGTTPRAAKKHLESVKAILKSNPCFEYPAEINERIEAESGKMSSANNMAAPPRGAFCMTLSSAGASEAIRVYVKMETKNAGDLKIREMELYKKDGVWRIDGITTNQGFGGYESVAAVVSAFGEHFLEFPCGTKFDELGDLLKHEKQETEEKRRREIRERQRLRKSFIHNRTNSPGRAHVQSILSRSKTSTTSTTADSHHHSIDNNSTTSISDNASTKQEKNTNQLQQQNQVTANKNEDEEDDDQEESNPFGDIAEFSETTCLLHRAVYSCDIDFIKKLLSTGSEGIVNYPQPDDIISGPENHWTPLIYACCSPVARAAESCKLLTDCGADVSFVDGHGRTALYYAILNGHADAVAHLLQCNPKLQATTTTISPLLTALGAHWLHPDINDIHMLAGVKVSADVIKAILYYGDHYQYHLSMPLEEVLVENVHDDEEQEQKEERGDDDVDHEHDFMNDNSTKSNHHDEEENEHRQHQETSESSLKSDVREQEDDQEEEHHEESEEFRKAEASIRSDLQLVLEILETKEKARDLSYACDEEKANGEYKKRHADVWKMHSTLIRDEQRERLKMSIVTHGAFVRSEPNGVAELFRAKRIVQGFLCSLSSRALCRKAERQRRRYEEAQAKEQEEQRRLLAEQQQQLQQQQQQRSMLAASRHSSLFHQSSNNNVLMNMSSSNLRKKSSVGSRSSVSLSRKSIVSATATATATATTTASSSRRPDDYAFPTN